MLNNHLQNDKILGVTKLKAFADNKLNIVKMMIPLYNRVENTVWLPAFSSFRTVFSKAFFRVVRSWDCVVELKKVHV